MFARTGALVALMTISAGQATAKEDDAVQLGEIIVDAGQRREATATNGPTGVKGYTVEAVSAGTKTNTPLVQIPQTISVVTRENLTDRNVQTLNEALTYTPAATADSTDVTSFANLM